MPSDLQGIFYAARSRLAFAACFVFLTIALAQAGQPPDLYFYPPSYRYEDGHGLNSPQTMTLKQATIDFPQIREMAGVVLMVYWSTLCPREDMCDFSLIDDTLSYWARREKKVIIDVATMGFPILKDVGGKERIENATPDWVLRRTRSYELRTEVLGAARESNQIVGVFPDFRDPKFFSEVKRLIRLLARYDGNSAVSQIRIATGMMGEDNPMVGPLSSPIAGYKEDMWLNYCRTVVAQYIQTFRRTELEFDIGRLSWMYSNGSTSDRIDVDNFVKYLARNRVLLAFDGLGSDSYEMLSSGLSDSNGVARSLFYIVQLKHEGYRVGLEAIGPVVGPRMTNIDGIARTIVSIVPNRLVFFQDFAALLNYSREGLNPRNDLTIRSLKADQINTFALGVKELLRAIKSLQ